MNKLYILFLLIALASCKKEYHCICSTAHKSIVTTNLITSSTITTTASSTIYNTQSKANSQCKDLDTTQNSGFTTVTCVTN